MVGTARHSLLRWRLGPSRPLGGPTDLHIRTALPQPGSPAITPEADAPITWPGFELGEKVATRSAYGAAVAALAGRPEVVVLDGEVSNSTHVEEFGKVAPSGTSRCSSPKQQLVASATGLAVRGYRPFASTFAVFFSQAFDFIRMAGISDVNISLVGSHAGVEIGQDGPSQRSWMAWYPAEGSATLTSRRSVASGVARAALDLFTNEYCHTSVCSDAGARLGSALTRSPSRSARDPTDRRLAVRATAGRPASGDEGVVRVSSARTSIGAFR